MRRLFEVLPAIHSEREGLVNIEERQGLQVACLEEIAYRRGWITADDVRREAAPMAKNDYGRRLSCFPALVFEFLTDLVT